MTRSRASVHDLPDDILQDIFALLNAECKQQVIQLSCRRWLQLLRSPRRDSWGHIALNLDSHRHVLGKSRTTFRPAGEELCRWLSARSSGISSLTLTGWFCSEESQLSKCSHKKFFDFHFGFLAGALQAGNAKLTLKLSGDSMFQCTVFQNAEFLKLVAPVLQHLYMTELEGLIPDEHISLLCNLTGLESLIIKSPEPRLLGGLMGLPESFRHLSNLRHLELENQIRIRSLPAGISALEKLEGLSMWGACLSELPHHMSRLTSLTSLSIKYNHTPLQISRELSCLQKLARLELSGCGMAAVPEAVTGMGNLTSLDMRVNVLSCVGQDWCPGGLSAVRSLKAVRFDSCKMDALSLNLCRATQLVSLLLQSNQLEELPPQVSNLVNLEHLDLSSNRFDRVPLPVEALPKLRFLKLSWQRLPPTARFRVDRPLSFLAGLEGLETVELVQTGTQPWDQVSLFHIGALLASLSSKGRPAPTVHYVHSQYGD
eukprot:jgi/Botrbrau1/20510/Bobra.145_2s0063.1